VRIGQRWSTSWTALSSWWSSRAGKIPSQVQRSLYISALVFPSAWNQRSQRHPPMLNNNKKERHFLDAFLFCFKSRAEKILQGCCCSFINPDIKHYTPSSAKDELRKSTNIYEASSVSQTEYYIYVCLFARCFNSPAFLKTCRDTWFKKQQFNSRPQWKSITMFLKRTVWKRSFAYQGLTINAKVLHVKA